MPAAFLELTGIGKRIGGPPVLEWRANQAFPLMRSSAWYHGFCPRSAACIQISAWIFWRRLCHPERLLNDGRIDFAIFSGGDPNPKLEYEVLGQEEILLAVSADNPWQRCCLRSFKRGRLSDRGLVKTSITRSSSCTIRSRIRSDHRTSSEKARNHAYCAILYAQYAGGASSGPANEDCFAPET